MSSSPRRASRTALMTAAYRARASTWETPLFSDPWADRLAGPEGHQVAREYERGFAPMELWAALRTAYIDAHLDHWTGAGGEMGQVVLLGAGLDTRAARKRRDGVRYFEVDMPASQVDKRERIAALEDYPVDAATYVPCDFETDDFVDKLSAAGFDPGKPAFVIWEGVTAYLTEPAIRATLRAISERCAERTVLIFDYLSRQMAEGRNISKSDEQTRDLVSGLGEQFRWGSNDPVPMLSEEGFRYVRVISFDEICLAMCGDYDRARLFRFQHMAVASRWVPNQL